MYNQIVTWTAFAILAMIFFCSLSAHFEEQTAEKSRFLLFMLCVEINFPCGIYATP